MQPYFLPYLGYFQLLAAVDNFVLLDDANYINRGWINRNRILVNGDVHKFSLPLQGASQNRLICEIELQCDTVWKDKLLRKIRHAYSKAPHYSEVMPLLENTIEHPSTRLDEFLLYSLRAIVDYLELNTHIIESSRVYNNSELSGQDRIVDICKQEMATQYINAIGGRGLYSSEKFNSLDIDLKFLQSRGLTYRQLTEKHISGLSIVDVMMFNSRTEIQAMLKEYDLISP